MTLAAARLSKLFSLCLTEGRDKGSKEEEQVNQGDLHDLAIAYGLLVKEAVSSQKLCDDLSQEAS